MILPDSFVQKFPRSFVRIRFQGSLRSAISVTIIPSSQLNRRLFTCTSSRSGAHSCTLHGRRRSFKAFILGVVAPNSAAMALESGLISSRDQRRMEAARWLALTAELASLLDIVYFFKPVRNSNESYVFQIFDVHEACNAENETQFRLTLADGHNLQRAVLTPELNEMVKNTQLVIKPGSIVRIREYSLYESVYHEQKRLIKIHDMDVPMVKFDLIERSQDYFIWPGQDGMDWKEPEDWEEGNWEWLDPEDPQLEWPAHDFE